MSLNRAGRLAVVAAAFSSVALGLPSGAQALNARLSVGGAAPLPAAARVLGALPVATPLHLAVALEPQDPLALQDLATAVSTPGDPQFGDYLSVPQFAARFGATAAAISAVRSALRTEGLSVGDVSANHLMIDATGTAAQVESALDVSLSAVKLSSGRVAFADGRSPTLPATVAGYVQGVIGLDSVGEQQPQGLTRVTHPAVRSGALRDHALGAGPTPSCSGAIAANNDQDGYTADQIAGAYGLSSFYPSDEGAGQTVALLEEEPYAPDDIDTYQSCYGTDASVTPVNVDGGPGEFMPGNADLGDDEESALDIEQVIGLAPQANILVYQGQELSENPASPSDILTAIVSQDAAKVISSSYGLCEQLTDPSVIASENSTLEEAAIQGQSFFISSGDSGSNMCFQANSSDTGLSVIDPGAQPFATGVGGTTMGVPMGSGNSATVELPTDGSYPGEYVWNDGYDPNDGASATGGGVSDQWAMPSYQLDAASSLGVINAASSKSCDGEYCREVPDISADADPNTGYIVYSTVYDDQTRTSTPSWNGFGGTSAAAPLWAAFTALMNASPACRGLTLGFENPALYKLAATSYASDFHDITQASPFTQLANNDALDGSSENSENPGDLYPLETGYDMATGLGTPIAPSLGAALCALRAPLYAVSATSPGAQQGVVGRPVSLQLSGTDSGGAALRYKAVNLPAGLTVSTAGLVTGTPTAAGDSTVTVTATDQYTNAGSTQFTWSIIKPGPPKVTGVTLSGVTGDAPKLSFSVAAGANAPLVSTVQIALPSGLSLARAERTVLRGITVKSGGKKIAFGESGAGSKLVVKLKVAAAKLSITVGKPAITESSGLRTRAKQHVAGKLRFGLKVADAGGTTTPFSVSLKG